MPDSINLKTRYYSITELPVVIYKPCSEFHGAHHIGYCIHPDSP